MLATQLLFNDPKTPSARKINSISILFILVGRDCLHLFSTETLDALDSSWVARSFLAVQDVAVLQTHYVETVFLELVSYA